MHMIHREDRNGVAVLRMEHGKVSALDLELLADLGEQFAGLRRESVRTVVLTGTGSSFSAGVDLFRVLQGRKEYLKEFLPALESMLREVFQFPRPVVAAVNGHAIAGGCVMVCACDYRIMAEGNGRIGVTELLVGVPFPALLLEIVRACVAPQHFQSLVYTGRTCLPAEALTVGLVDELTGPETLMDRAFEVGERLAKISPHAFELTKFQVRRDAIDRAASYSSKDHAADVAETWAAPETHQMIDTYLKRTIRKK